MLVFIQQDEETKCPLVKKEEPDAAEPKQEPMETEEKKPEVKTQPKEEEEGGTNGTSTASAAQNRKKSKTWSNLYIFVYSHVFKKKKVLETVDLL